MANYSTFIPPAGASNVTWFDGKPYYTCDPKTRGSCMAIVGHERAECSKAGLSLGYGKQFKDPAAKAAAFCHCGPYGGILFSVDTSTGHGMDCFTADCVGGRDACRSMNGAIIASLIISALSTMFILLVVFMMVNEIIQRHKRKKLGKNAATTTVGFGFIASIFLLLWIIEPFIVVATQSQTYHNFAITVLVPIVAIFALVSALNLSLMWVQVSAAAKSLGKSGQNLSSRATTAVIITSALVAVVLATLAALNEGLIMQAFAGVIALGAAIIFTIGGCKMAATLSKNAGSDTRSQQAAARTIRATRQMSVTLSVFILSAVAVIFVEEEFGETMGILYQLLYTAMMLNALTSTLFVEVSYLKNSRVKKSTTINPTATASTTVSSS